MKNLLIVLALILTINTTNANDSTAYYNALSAQIELLNKSKTVSEYQTVANAFERIAQKETSEWLPNYYAALSYLRAGFQNNQTLAEKDNYFDKAISLIDQAEEISPNNSELVALRGYALMGKLSADAANRGQSMSSKVMQLFGKAIQLNPENPRALYLMAQMEYGMSQFFGTGTEKACGMAKQSLTLFDQNQEVSINPNWGQAGAKEMAGRCE